MLPSSQSTCQYPPTQSVCYFPVKVIKFLIRTALILLVNHVFCQLSIHQLFSLLMKILVYLSTIYYPVYSVNLLLTFMSTLSVIRSPLNKPPIFLSTVYCFTVYFQFTCQPSISQQFYVSSMIVIYLHFVSYLLPNLFVIHFFSQSIPQSSNSQSNCQSSTCQLTHLSPFFQVIIYMSVIDISFYPLLVNQLYVFFFRRLHFSLSCT